MPERLEEAVIAHLRNSGTPYCAIGAYAFAHHGVVRYTADIDLLVMSARVLSKSYWPPELASHISAIRRGDEGDPFEGIVVLNGIAPIDLLVGRGAIMRRAVSDAVEGTVGAAAPMRFASAIDLALLKLEAGGPKDLNDIVALIDTKATSEPGAPLLPQIAARTEGLSAWGKQSWARLQRLLEPPDLSQLG